MVPSMHAGVQQLFHPRPQISCPRTNLLLMRVMDLEPWPNTRDTSSLVHNAVLVMFTVNYRSAYLPEPQLIFLHLGIRIRPISGTRQ